MKEETMITFSLMCLPGNRPVDDTDEIYLGKYTREWTNPPFIGMEFIIDEQLYIALEVQAVEDELDTGRLTVFVALNIQSLEDSKQAWEYLKSRAVAIPKE